MKKTGHVCLAFLAFLTAFSTSLFAQNPSKINLRGTVIDTAGVTLPAATVMLLNPSDSTLVNFMQTNSDGFFEFKNVKNRAYLLKISFVSFLPLQKRLEPTVAETVDLGRLTIRPISSALLEIVVREARAPLLIRGDTIEYDASAFKVPPGSTVEDLLRRLPGIEVDADGNVRAAGQDVKRVYVDGKTFFSNDPKAATKNLGAETLSKIQVYDEKSEQARITGSDDGRREKAMNLELKEQFKNGKFGKVTAAAGTESRWAARGNYNRFNKKEQLSFIGYANNINQTGVNWEDYGEFKGQSSRNEWEDNADFGFSNLENMRVVMWDDDVRNNFDGRGFTKNAGAGTNYNFDNKKTKFNASYFFNQTDLALDQFSLRQTFLDNALAFQNADTLGQNELRGNHRIESRFEQKLDSNNILVLKMTARQSFSEADELKSQLFSNELLEPTSRVALDNSAGLGTLRGSATGIFRRFFPARKGRTLALSSGWSGRRAETENEWFSENYRFETGLFDSKTQLLSDLNASFSELKAGAMWIEPISKSWFWETFSNFRKAENEQNRTASDALDAGRSVDSLAFLQNFGVDFLNLGSSIRFSKKGANLTAGLAAQRIEMVGSWSSPGISPRRDPLIKSYFDLVPGANLSYEFPSRRRVSAGYNFNVKPPGVEQLQPVADVSNPVFRALGNPFLEAEKSHALNFSVNSWSAGRLSSIGLNGTLKLHESKIVYDQTTERLADGRFLTISQPVNRSGARGFNGWLWSNFPIIKTKLTANLNSDFTWQLAPAAVNYVLNETRTITPSMSGGLTFTPNSKLILAVSGNARVSEVRFSTNSDRNQTIENYGSDASVKWQFLKRTFFESNFSYALFRNKSVGLRREIPIWNASIRQIFGSTNRFEARLAAFDVFDQTVSVRQFSSINYVNYAVAPTLARYFMGSLSYNLRGYETKLDKEGGGGRRRF